jgi:hypothetical protein
MPTHRLRHVTPANMIKKRGFDVSTVHHLHDKNRLVTYRLELWEQPLHRWLIAQIYHWYDMRIFKVPGFRKLERFLEARHKGDPFLYLPLGVQQDCRCYSLTVKQKTILADVEVDKATRDRIYRNSYYG